MIDKGFYRSSIVLEDAKMAEEDKNDKEDVEMKEVEVISLDPETGNLKIEEELFALSEKPYPV